MRETSATGHIRSGQNPRIRAQDGLKVPLLCEGCEQRFSILEREFANKIFYPMQRENVLEVAYARWFLKFCVSISWRVLTFGVQRHHLVHLSEAQHLRISNALAVWAQFLLDEVVHPGEFEQRLVLLGAIGTASRNCDRPLNVNTYFLRSVGIDVVTSENTTFTHAKLGPFVLLGLVDVRERWEGTKINANAGVVGSKSYKLPEALYAYWSEQAKRHANIYEQIPKAQHEKITAEVRRNPKRFRESETFKAMEHDISIFGIKAFREGG